MVWFQRLLKPSAKVEKDISSISRARQRANMPTVQFDSSLVTKKLKRDLRQNIEQLGDIPKKHVCEIYNAALGMIEAGENTPVLYNALLKLDGMTTGRASEITRILASKAKALTEQESRARLGITHAIWMYANAPCMVNPSHPTDADRKQDAAHKAANGKRFEIGKGLLINGEWTLPGRGNGCKCVSRSVIPGLESSKR
jgi:hypothetical protein